MADNSFDQKDLEKQVQELESEYTDLIKKRNKSSSDEERNAVREKMVKNRAIYDLLHNKLHYLKHRPKIIELVLKTLEEEDQQKIFKDFVESLMFSTWVSDFQTKHENAQRAVSHIPQLLELIKELQKLFPNCQFDEWSMFCTLIDISTCWYNLQFKICHFQPEFNPQIAFRIIFAMIQQAGITELKEFQDTTEVIEAVQKHFPFELKSLSSTMEILWIEQYSHWGRITLEREVAEFLNNKFPDDGLSTSHSNMRTVAVQKEVRKFLYSTQ